MNDSENLTAEQLAGKQLPGNQLNISYLQSGGLITNYYCSSRCKHCLYASSPKRTRDYIDEKTAAKLFEKIKSLGCHSLHIGGGEPFLNIHGLKGVLEAAQKESMRIDYVETNSSWYKDHDSACRAPTCFLNLYGRKKTGKLVQDNSTDIGCIELTNTSHFHFDLYENYIPGLCSGIQIDYRDMGSPLSENKYPFLHVLYRQGIKGFLQVARERYNFVPRENYVSKCHLCLDIRRFMVIERNLEINEFGPRGFYEEIYLN